jgi:hypothetical protein
MFKMAINPCNATALFQDPCLAPSLPFVDSFTPFVNATFQACSINNVTISSCGDLCLQPYLQFTSEGILSFCLRSKQPAVYAAFNNCMDQFCSTNLKDSLGGCPPPKPADFPDCTSLSTLNTDIGGVGVSVPTSYNSYKH